MFDIALQEFQEARYAAALDYVKQAIDAANQHFPEAWFLLADIYGEMGDNQGIITTLEKILQEKPDLFPTAWYNLGKAFFSEGQYIRAQEALNRFVQYPGQNEALRKRADYFGKCCEFALQAMKNPVPFTPVSLGDSINTPYDEYWPSLSADEQTLVYTALVPKNPKFPIGPKNQQEDFYISYFQGGKWKKGENLGEPLNSSDNEGAQSLTPDGRTMYFTACNRPDGKGQCDIYVSCQQGGVWTPPRNLGDPVNTRASEKQPSVSPDGKTLYFVSNRPGTRGGLDIWYSVKKDDGSWQPPVNIGDSINTEGDEQSPFIHTDNTTLYFSSNHRIGMGGFDIYLSWKKPDGSWTTAKNLGYPINTFRDEIGLIVTASGKKAYFASNREPCKGNDLYVFDLYADARPSPVSYMKGIVTDAISKKALEANFQLINLQTGELIVSATSDPVNGKFLVPLPAGYEYLLNVSRPGYLFYSDHFALNERYTESQPFLKNIELRPIRPGEKAVMKNIFFEFNSSELKAESLVEIDKLCEFLKSNPEVKVEISGHTDNTGTHEYNVRLSQSRAKVVAEYLIAKGISPSRLVAKGYGETRPVASNDTEEGRAQNRRTEFMIVEK